MLAPSRRAPTPQAACTAGPPKRPRRAAPAGVTLVPLDGAGAAGALAAALDPARDRVDTGRLTVPPLYRRGRARRPRRRAEDRHEPHRLALGPSAMDRSVGLCRLCVRSRRRRGPPRALRVGDGWCASFAVVGYPREVGTRLARAADRPPGAASTSRCMSSRFRPPVAADRLRRQLARLESGRRADAARGRLADPDVEVAAEDARDLAAGLARGEQRLFRVGLYLTVHAPSEAGARRRVRPGARAVRLDAARRPASHLAHAAGLDHAPCRWGSTRSAQRRSFDTDALAARFPFASAELSATTGVLYGTTTNGSGLVLWDRFAQDNHNSVILARSGAGKSYLAKLEALRSLYRGIEVAVVDPEDEYRRLAEAVGGAYVHLGAPGVRVNPFDLATRARRAATRRALFVHTLVAVLLGEKLDPAATAGARPGHRRRLRVGRDHGRPAQPRPPRPAARRPGRARSKPTATPPPAPSPPGSPRS